MQGLTYTNGTINNQHNMEKYKMPRLAPFEDMVLPTKQEGYQRHAITSVFLCTIFREMGYDTEQKRLGSYLLKNKFEHTWISQPKDEVECQEDRKRKYAYIGFLRQDLSDAIEQYRLRNE